MPNSQNPYDPPKESELSPPTSTTADWRSFAWLNTAIATAVGILVLISFLYSKYMEILVNEQLGRRYATYDHEFHYYPINGLIFFGVIFAVPNIVLFMLKFMRRRRA